jgi:hypothetical protein
VQVNVLDSSKGVYNNLTTLSIKIGEKTCNLYSECPFAMGLTRLGDLTLGSPLERRLTLYVNNEAKLAISMA